ncbi:MAG: acireductone synthase [Gammaproteobacteria bacterium]|nr:acireductone synthase [Gammaproteobacteria bacterium]
MSIAAILTDIEGTTSSIEFVHEVLFPYASENLAAFVRENQDHPGIAKLISDARDEAGEPDANTEEVIAILLQWIREDRKATALKALQGKLWRFGYVNGDFTGHVYPDAVSHMQSWYEAGIPIYVYSSGSVQAQQLLFGYSNAGDLRAFFSGFFDTRVGHKRKPSSYSEIATMIGYPPENILFLSDVAGELDAAREAGMQTVQIVRDDNVVVGDHRVAQEFGEVMT